MLWFFLWRSALLGAVLGGVLGAAYGLLMVALAAAGTGLLYALFAVFYGVFLGTPAGLALGVIGGLASGILTRVLRPRTSDAGGYRNAAGGLSAALSAAVLVSAGALAPKDNDVFFDGGVLDLLAFAVAPLLIATLAMWWVGRTVARWYIHRRPPCRSSTQQ